MDDSNAEMKVLDGYTMADEVRGALLKNINRRLTPQAVKIRADLEVTCFAYDGILYSLHICHA
jgi:translation initiation factor 2 subunit 1